MRASGTAQTPPMSPAKLSKLQGRPVRERSMAVRGQKREVRGEGPAWLPGSATGSLVTLTKKVQRLPVA